MGDGKQLVDDAVEGRPVGVNPTPRGSGEHLQKEGGGMGVPPWLGYQGKDAAGSNFRKFKALLKTF